MGDIKNRKWGDRRDARWVKDVPGLQTVMMHLMPNRTDCEVYLNDTFDVTELVKFIEQKNIDCGEYKTTLFHCVVMAVARMVHERPKLNRFIQGRRMYERDDISLSFVAKRRFTDAGEETLMVVEPKDEESLKDITKKIVGDVKEARKSEVATGGIDELLDKFAALPRPVLMLAIRVIRWMDFWGKNPKGLTEGDPNYTTVLLSNLGSIKCPSIYHHLNNYGTNSIMITIGTMHKEEMVMPDGHKEIRDVINLGATLDERIGDGFYFARSLKLIHYIFAHPELLDKPLGEPSGFDYEAK